MSDFLEELKRRINECSLAMDDYSEYEHGETLNEEDVYNAAKMVDSLGENARKMLTIGILQDDLIKLGFARSLVLEQEECFDLAYSLFLDENCNSSIDIEFNFTHSTITVWRNGASIEEFQLGLQCGRDVVIDKVEALINVNQP